MSSANGNHDVLVASTAVLEDKSVLKLAGELDLAGRPVVVAATSALFEQAAPDLEVCLEDLRFIDCGGVGVLLEVRNRHRSGGGTFRVCHAAGEVAMVLDRTGVGAQL